MPSSYHSLVAESCTVPYRIAESPLTLPVSLSYLPKSPLSSFLSTGTPPRCLLFLVFLTALLSSSSFRFADLLRPSFQISPRYRELPRSTVSRRDFFARSTSFCYPLPSTPTGYSTTHSSQHPPDSLVYALLRAQPQTKCFTVRPLGARGHLPSG